MRLSTMDDTPAPARTYTAPTPGADTLGGELGVTDVPTAEKGNPSMFDDLPLSLWQAANEGLPFSADFFHLENYYRDDTFMDMANDMLYLDWYAQKKIEEHGLEDSQESYKQVIAEIIEKIGTTATEKSTQLFTRIVVAVKALERLDSVKISPELTEAPRLAPTEVEGITSEYPR